jgi:hypothetical protein
VSSTQRLTLAQSNRTHDHMPHTSSSRSFFMDSLSTLPNEDWRRHWPAEKTLLLRMASKRLRAAVDKLHPPASVYLSRTVWADARSGARPLAAISQFVLLQLSAVPSRCRITTLDLSGELPSANVRTRGGRAACGSAGAVPRPVLPRSGMESARRSRGW